MHFSIGKKLTMGFGLVVVLILASTLENIYLLSDVRKSQKEVIETRFAMMMAGKNLVNGVNQSLAALRGYMILGGEQGAAKRFKMERKQAWQHIANAIISLDSLSDNLDDESKQIINEIRPLLADIKLYQIQIEEIAQTPQNQPALELMLNQAGPQSKQMLVHLQNMIEIEADLEADEERKTLLKYLADSHGAFATSIDGLRAYLITGDSAFKDQFDTNWQINTDAYIEIDDNIDMLTDEQLADWQEYESLRELFAPVSIEMFRLRVSPKWNIANHQLENDVEPLVQQITELLHLVSVQQEQSVELASNDLEDSLSFVFIVMLIAAGVVLLVSIATAVYIVRDISRAMDMLVSHSAEISNGNLACAELTEELTKGNDEFGELARDFEQMSHSLSDMIAKVKGHGIQMRVASFQVASLSEEILCASQQEENRSSEVTEATEQLIAASQTNLNLAGQALEVVLESEKQAHAGISAVDATIAEMESSVNEVKRTSSEIAELEEASQHIYDITGTIHQIADQTNLLALNAAIEAARAGEHGRGFAVVADEVRNLATKTSEATVEITNLIKVLREKVEQSIESMDRAAKHVFESQNCAAQTASAINAIGDSVQHISESNQQISQSADIQMNQLGLLQEKLSQLFETLREDGSRAGAVSINAQVLFDITQNINDALSQFRTYVPQIDSSIERDRRHSKRVQGCLRVEVTQGISSYEGVTSDIGEDSLGITMSRPLDLSKSVILTIFVPYNNFIDYKNQMPLMAKGKLIRGGESGQVYQYGLTIELENEQAEQQLKQAFEFFEKPTMSAEILQ